MVIDENYSGSRHRPPHWSCWNLAEECCAPFGCCLNNQRTANCCQSLANSDETESAGRSSRPRGSLFVKAGSIVFYDEPHLSGIGLESHADLAGIGMLRNVGHRLLKHTIKRDLDRRRQSPSAKVAYKIHIQTEAFAPLLEVVCHRSLETEIVERCGPELPRKLVDFSAYR